MVDHSELEIRPDLSYTERPMVILDRTTKELKKQTIPLVLVSWGIKSPGEAAWEREDVICDSCPYLFHDD